MLEALSLIGFAGAMVSAPVGIAIKLGTKRSTKGKK